MHGTINIKYCKIISPQDVRQQMTTDEVEKRQNAQARNVYKILIEKKKY